MGGHVTQPKAAILPAVPAMIHGDFEADISPQNTLQSPWITSSGLARVDAGQQGLL